MTDLEPTYLHLLTKSLASPSSIWGLYKCLIRSILGFDVLQGISYESLDPFMRPFTGPCSDPSNGSFKRGLIGSILGLHEVISYGPSYGPLLSFKESQLWAPKPSTLNPKTLNPKP